MKAPRLMVLSDFGSFPDALLPMRRLCEWAEPESVALVLRDRDRSVRERIQWGREMRALTRDTGQNFLVSDRLDVALALGAAGVHLPAAGLLPRQVRGSVSWVSRAAHDLDALADDELVALDAALVSPVVEPRKGRAPLGWSGLTQRTAALQARARGLCVYALGGVEACHVAACRKAGAQGVAVIGAALRPGAPLEALLDALEIRDGGRVS